MDFPWSATAALITISVAISVPLTTRGILGIVRTMAEGKHEVTEARMKSISEISELRFRVLEQDITQLTAKTEHSLDKIWKAVDAIRGHVCPEN